MMISIQEANELGDRYALGDERIFDGSVTRIIHQHAADDRLATRQPELPCDNPMELRECGLWVCIGTPGTHGYHRGFQKHAVVKPAVLPHHAVDRKDDADRRIEEPEVTRMLRIRALLVGAPDVGQAIEIPAGLAVSALVRIDPYAWVVQILLVMHRARLRVDVRRQHRFG